MNNKNNNCVAVRPKNKSRNINQNSVFNHTSLTKDSKSKQSITKSPAKSIFNKKTKKITNNIFQKSMITNSSFNGYSLSLSSTNKNKKKFVKSRNVGNKNTSNITANSKNKYLSTNPDCGNFNASVTNKKIFLKKEKQMRIRYLVLNNNNYSSINNNFLTINYNNTAENNDGNHNNNLNNINNTITAGNNGKNNANKIGNNILNTLDEKIKKNVSINNYNKFLDKNGSCLNNIKKKIKKKDSYAGEFIKTSPHNNFNISSSRITNSKDIKLIYKRTENNKSNNNIFNNNQKNTKDMKTNNNKTNNAKIISDISLKINMNNKKILKTNRSKESVTKKNSINSINYAMSYLHILNNNVKNMKQTLNNRDKKSIEKVRICSPHYYGYNIKLKNRTKNYKKVITIPFNIFRKNRKSSSSNKILKNIVELNNNKFIKANSGTNIFFGRIPQKAKKFKKIADLSIISNKENNNKSNDNKNQLMAKNSIKITKSNKFSFVPYDNIYLNNKKKTNSITKFSYEKVNNNSFTISNQSVNLNISLNNKNHTSVTHNSIFVNSRINIKSSEQDQEIKTMNINTHKISIHNLLKTHGNLKTTFENKIAKKNDIQNINIYNDHKKWMNI